MTGPDILTHALDYANNGWRVIPIRPGEKRPALNNWTQHATTNPDTIRTWWTGPYRDHGIGIATGHQTGMFVLDVDITDTKAGDETLAELETLHGPLPDTLTSITGSGGLHLFFQWPAGHTIRNDAGRRLGPGLDIRGEGGQIVAAPTRHPNGRLYQWDALQPTTPAPAPDWLIKLLIDPPTPTPPTTTPATIPSDEDGPAARYNQTTTWPQLLTADGWTLTRTLPDGEQHWTRPGKDPRDGISATTGYNQQDCLTVFTSSIPWLPEGTYSRFGYHACRHHHGDRSQAAAHLNHQTQQTDQNWLAQHTFTPPTPTLDHDQPLRQELAHLVNWQKLWTDDRPDEEWLAEPIIPKGRSVALYAPAKAGKSTIALSVVAAVATGSRILGHTRTTPTNVLYLDYEMTEDDLIERLTDLGYGPQDNLDHLHYALLPSLPPLDTPAGALAILQLCDHTKAELVVVDTFGRAVEGDEDKADTVRAFYRNTGLALKTRGIAVLRTDHSGKDTSKGMRGSSAKNDDVDLVWQLTRTDTRKGAGLKLTRTHSRISWVPPELAILRNETDYGHEYVINHTDNTWPDGTRQDAELLDELDLPIDCGFNHAKQAVRDTGHKMRDQRIRTAIKFRKAQHASEERLRISKGIHLDTSEFAESEHYSASRPTRSTPTGRANGTRQRDAHPQNRDAPDAQPKPQVTDLQKRDALHPQRDALDTVQRDASVPIKGRATGTTPTSPIPDLF